MIKKVIAAALLGSAFFLQAQTPVKKDSIKSDDQKEKIVFDDLDEVVLFGSRNYKSKRASTSLRLKTPMVEIPQNIQVVNKKILEDQHIFDLFDGIERNVSGVRRSAHQQTYASVNIRGFMARGGSSSFRNGMSTSGYFGPLKEDASFVERIEFVKGPGGFMLSNGEPGGFYNVVTKKPTGISRNSVSFSMGSFGIYRAEADNQGKISDKVWFRLNTMGQMRGSHIDYQYTKGYAIAPVITFAPNKKTKITFEYNRQYSQFGGFAPYVYSFKGFKDAPRNRSYLDPAVNPVRVTDQNVFLTLNREVNERWDITSQIAYFRYVMRGEDLGPVYNDLKKNGDVKRAFGLLDVNNYSAMAQFFLQGEIEKEKVKHRILAGVDMGRKWYYADWSGVRDMKFVTPFNINKPGDYLLKPNQVPKINRSNSLRIRSAGRNYRDDRIYASVYLQDEIGFFEDKFRLTLAGRFTKTDKRDFKNSGFATNNVFSPRAGLSFSYAKNGTAYLLYDQSFTENYGKLKNGKDLKASKGNNIELGVKKEFSDGRLSSAISIYQITKTNLPAAAGTRAKPYYTQVGEAKSRGFELDITGEVLPRLNAVMNYAYTDAKISKDANLKNIGKKLPGSAKHIANMWLSYSVAKEGLLKNFTISSGFQWQKDRATFPFGEGVLPDDYFSLNAGLSYSKNNVNIGLLINNITDKYNYNGAFPGAWGYKHYLWQTEPGANYRIKVGYSF